MLGLLSKGDSNPAKPASKNGAIGRQGLRGFDGRALIILLEGLSDSLTFTPALRAFRRSFPRARIELLVNDIGYEVYRTSRHVDDCILLNNGSGRGRRLVSLLSMLRENSYHVAITPSPLFRHTSLTYLAGAEIRAGSAMRVEAASAPYGQ